MDEINYQDQIKSQPKTPTSNPSSAGVPSNPAFMWGMLCHLSALCGFIIPFGNIILPLVLWQIKKAEFPFVDENGKEAHNFQICVSIYCVGAWVLMFLFIGFLILPALVIANIVLVIIAGIKAGKGESYKYPYIFRLVK